MLRRSILSALAGSAVSTVLSVSAQTGKTYRIGWLSSQPLAVQPQLMQVFSQGMRERGWAEGRNYVIENLHSDGKAERVPVIAAEIVRSNVDLIISAGTPGSLAVKAATTTIPIVFFFVGDPVGSGLVGSLARPGGNVTGFGGLGPGVYAKQLELLKATVPSASRVAMVFNPDLPFHPAFRAEVEAAARLLGLTLVPVVLRGPDEIDAAFAVVARSSVDALHIFGQSFLFAQADRISRMAIAQRLPAIIAFSEVTRAGMLMSYGWELIDDVRRLPNYVDRILKGARPADLPVEQPSQFRLTINLKTARAIGVTVPQNVLLRADEVIE